MNATYDTWKTSAPSCDEMPPLCPCCEPGFVGLCPCCDGCPCGCGACGDEPCMFEADELGNADTIQAPPFEWERDVPAIPAAAALPAWLVDAAE